MRFRISLQSPNGFLAFSFIGLFAIIAAHTALVGEPVADVTPAKVTEQQGFLSLIVMADCTLRDLQIGPGIANTNPVVTADHIEGMCTVCSWKSISIHYANADARGLRAIAALPNLEKLTISKMLLGRQDVETIGRSRSVESIAFYDTNVNCLNLMLLKNCSTLKSLHVQEKSLSKNDLVRLKAALKNVEVTFGD